MTQYVTITLRPSFIHLFIHLFIYSFIILVGLGFDDGRKFSYASYLAMAEEFSKAYFSKNYSGEAPTYRDLG